MGAVSEALATMVQELTMADITQRKVDLYPSDYIPELQDKLSNHGVLLMASSCQLVGSSRALDAAQESVSAAVSKIYGRRPVGHDTMAIDDTQRDLFCFRVPRGYVTVHVRQGDNLFCF